MTGRFWVSTEESEVWITYASDLTRAIPYQKILSPSIDRTRNARYARNDMRRYRTMRSKQLTIVKIRRFSPRGAPVL
jgi:hypothetical protein